MMEAILVFTAWKEDFWKMLSPQKVINKSLLDRRSHQKWIIFELESEIVPFPPISIDRKSTT